MVAVWRIQAAAMDLARALAAHNLAPQALVLPDAALTGLVPDSAYVERPSFFLPERASFVAVLAYFVSRSLPFRLLVRAADDQSIIMQAYPRLDPLSLQLLAQFDSLAAEQIEDLCTRIEEGLASLTLLPAGGAAE